MVLVYLLHPIIPSYKMYGMLPRNQSYCDTPANHLSAEIKVVS